MPTVTPPPTVTSTPAAGTTPLAGGVTPVEAGVGNAPDKIAQLARQIQVSGLITAPPADGEITLSTIIGNLTIVLPQLAKDQQDKLMNQLLSLFQNQKPLTVVVQPGDPPSQAILLLPPSTSSAATTNSPPNLAQTNVLLQTASSPPPAPVTVGSVLPAVVLQPNTLIANTPAPLGVPLTPSPLPTDAELALLTDITFLDELAAKAEAIANQIIPEAQARILSDAYQAPLQQSSLTPAPSQPLGQPISQSPVSPPLLQLGTSEPLPTLPPTPQATPTAPQPFPTTSQLIPNAALAEASLPQTLTPTNPQQITVPPPLSSLFQPGTEINLRVDALALPSQPLPVPFEPDQILATVTGSGPGGQLLVQAGDTTLYVKASVNAPVGSTLLVTVEVGKPPVLMPLPLPDVNDFGTLQQALATLAQADPQLARQVIENVIPQPNAALGGALLFLLSAFGKSDVRSWLGNNTIDILTRAGKMELIARLTQELSEGGQTVSDPVVGAWRSYTVPLHANNQFQTLHLYVHSDGHGGGKKGETGGGKPAANAVRFLIDMRLSRLGPLQLDGFVRPKQMDMIIRSEKLLPDGLNQDLRHTYIKALDAVGYAGTLNFQTGRQSWMNLRKPGAGSVVT